MRDPLEVAPFSREVLSDGPLSAGVTAGQGFRALGLVAVYGLGSAGASVAAHAAGLIDLRKPGGIVMVLALVTAAAMVAAYLQLVRKLRLSPAALGFVQPAGDCCICSGRSHSRSSLRPGSRP